MRRVNPASKRARPSERRVLLLVEDDPLNKEVAELWLTERYEVLWAENAQKAIALLTVHRSRIEAILMDIELKGSELDGVELTKVLRGLDIGRRLPPFAHIQPVNVPIFFVTAYANRVLSPDQSGADGVVTKPVNFFDLQMRLTQAHLNRLNTR